MIISYRHKGLKAFRETGSTKGIQPSHAAKLGIILDLLDVAANFSELSSVPGLRPHPLKGREKDFISVEVNGNWRVTFRFIGSDIELVDYRDYH